MSRRHSRGGVAVEFALVFPMFIATFGMTFSLGQALWVRAQMVDITSSAARLCTMQIQTGPTPLTTSTAATTMAQNCAQQYITQQMAAGLLVGACNNQLTPSILVTPSDANLNLWLLQIRLVCQRTLLPMVNAITGSAINTDMTLQASSGMPFVLGL